MYAKGSHYAVGYTVGRAQRVAVRGMIAGYREFTKSIRLSWDDALQRARAYLPSICCAFPQYVEEMRGLADGAGVSFDGVLLMNALEEVATQASTHVGCTSVGVGPARTARRTTLLGHNEDWLYQDYGRAYLVHAEPDGEPAFLSMSYGGFLPAVGFNAWGIAQGCDSLDHDDDQLGIPRMLVARRVLAARSLDEAIQVCTMPGRAAGYNHLLADSSGRLLNLELSATDHDLLLAGNGATAHANCYLSPHMTRRGTARPEAIADSMGRVRRCLELMDGKPEPGEHPRPQGLDVEDLAAVLADHAGLPDGSICCHEGEHQAQRTKAQTLATVIIDLDEWTIWAAAGNPCRATFCGHVLEPGARAEAA